MSYEPGDLVWIRPCAIDGARQAGVVAAVEETPMGRMYTLQIGGVRRAPLYDEASLEPRERPERGWD